MKNSILLCVIAFALFSCGQKKEADKKTVNDDLADLKNVLAKKLPKRTAEEMRMDSVYEDIVDSVNSFIAAYGDGRGLGDAWWDSKITADQPFNRIRLCKTLGGTTTVIERRIFPFNDRGEVLGYTLVKEYLADNTFRYFVESSRFMRNEEIVKERKREYVETPEEMVLATEAYRVRLKQAFDNRAVLNGRQEREKNIRSLSKNG